MSAEDSRKPAAALADVRRMKARRITRPLPKLTTWVTWTGPREGDLAADGSTLARAVPPERCPWCEIDEHDLGCTLRDRGLVAGAFCDCSASDLGAEK